MEADGATALEGEAGLTIASGADQKGKTPFAEAEAGAVGATDRTSDIGGTNLKPGAVRVLNSLEPQVAGETEHIGQRKVSGEDLKIQEPSGPSGAGGPTEAEAVDPGDQGSAGHGATEAAIGAVLQIGRDLGELHHRTAGIDAEEAVGHLELPNGASGCGDGLEGKVSRQNAAGKFHAAMEIQAIGGHQGIQGDAGGAVVGQEGVPPDDGG